MKNLVLILLLSGLYCTTVSAQDASGNRRKVIDMVLAQSLKKVCTDGHQAGIYALTPTIQPETGNFRSSGAIPRYCLAKGAVICRLEEYVQLHSPFKLNIGVGGE